MSSELNLDDQLASLQSYASQLPSAKKGQALEDTAEYQYHKVLLTILDSHDSKSLRSDLDDITSHLIRLIGSKNQKQEKLTSKDLKPVIDQIQLIRDRIIKPVEKPAEVPTLPAAELALYAAQESILTKMIVQLMGKPDPLSPSFKRYQMIKNLRTSQGKILALVHFINSEPACQQGQEITLSRIYAGPKLLNDLRLNFPNLKRISLVGCNLTSIPDWVFNSKNLQVLDLRGNKLIDTNTLNAQKEKISTLSRLECIAPVDIVPKDMQDQFYKHQETPE